MSGQSKHSHRFVYVTGNDLILELRILHYYLFAQFQANWQFPGIRGHKQSKPFFLKMDLITRFSADQT